MSDFKRITSTKGFDYVIAVNVLKRIVSLEQLLKWASTKESEEQIILVVSKCIVEQLSHAFSISWREFG